MAHCGLSTIHGGLISASSINAEVVPQIGVKRIVVDGREYEVKVFEARPAWGAQLEQQPRPRRAKKWLDEYNY